VFDKFSSKKKKAVDKGTDNSGEIPITSKP